MKYWTLDCNFVHLFADGAETISFTSPRNIPDMCIRGFIDSRAIVRLNGIGKLKNPVFSSRMEPATFWLVA
jgi:hypothetical protein